MFYQTPQTNIIAHVLILIIKIKDFLPLPSVSYDKQKDSGLLCVYHVVNW